MNISVVGTGYVGLVTGVCLSEMGNQVCCVDVDESKVERLRNGETPIYEPQLDNLFKRNLSAHRLTFTTSLQEGLNHGQIIFLALPTPEDEDGSADLSYILGVAEEIGRYIKDYKIIVNKSTVPVGTADLVKAIISNHTDIEFDVVSNPEFLREGVAVEDFMKPDRIIIGSRSEKATDLMKKLYEPFIQSDNLILTMDERSSELTKYAANSFLATKITFMNEVANLCEKVGANVDHIRQGMGADSRIGKHFLFPGIGYGGSCFPKDVKALNKISEDAGYDFNILDAVVRTNEHQRTILLPKMVDHLKNLNGKKIGIWGLAFKPETDDIREAPALYMIDNLLEHGATIQVFDPEAMNNVKHKYGNKLNYSADIYSTLKDADALLICTEWAVFRTPDFNRMKSLMSSAVIFDGRNLYDPKDLESKGFYYQSIGR